MGIVEENKVRLKCPCCKNDILVVEQYNNNGITIFISLEKINGGVDEKS